MKNLITFLLAFSSLCFAQNFWEPTNGPNIGGGTNNTIINALATDMNGTIYAGIDGDEGMFYTTDEGFSWVQCDTLYPDTNIYSPDFSVLSIVTNNAGYVFAGTENGVFKSTNNGIDWQHTSLKFPRVYCLEINNNQELFAGTASQPGIFKSTDNGITWSSHGSFEFVLGLEIDNNGYIYASPSQGNNSGIYRSIDNGISWTTVNNGISVFDSYRMTVNNSNVIYAAEYSPSGNVFYSTDSGDNWFQTNASAEFFKDIITNNLGYIYAGSFYSGVYMSMDNGISWAEINDGLDTLSILSFTFSPSGKLFVGTNGKGVYKSVNSTTNIDYEISNIRSYQLGDNYPNPFNPTTTIQFQIPKLSFVTIKIYDILGEEIATLVSEEKPIGNYEVKFDGNNFTSGVYFYRMQSGNFSVTKKLILIK